MPHPPVFRRVIAVTFGCVFAAATMASAQTSFGVVAALDGSSARPMGGVIKASNGVLYGTANQSGAACGAVYKVTGIGAWSVVHSFSGTDGCNPVGELVQGTDGHLYGTTNSGGPNTDDVFTSGTGTVFRIELPDETFSMIHAFAPLDEVNGWYPEGVAPFAGLTVGNDGNLYGTTNAGGQTTGFANGCGTVFQVTPDGVLTVLRALEHQNDGCAPNAGVTLGPDGNFYGTASIGGGDGNGASGTVFKVTPEGVFTRLFAFLPHVSCNCHADGFQPASEPVFDSAGNMYGTASAGGPNGAESGTVWKLSPGGVFTVLKAFSNDGVDGSFPFSGLTRGSDGLLYGVTTAGGANGSGVIFRIANTGGFLRLHSFALAGGASPDGRLLELSPGVFFGTTTIGGAAGGGVVFRFTVPVADIDVNGEDGPITLGAGDPFHLTLAYKPNVSVVNPARVYVGVSAPFGLYWLTGAGFTATQGALYTGPLSTISLATLVNLSDAAALPAGSYVWFVIVDTDGVGDAVDFVQVTVSP
jgi:uncharacterized repeat protein (TIGR03803 family)